MKKELAIIIPAYKKQFFRESLNSLASQSDKNFTLYIGDDNCTSDLYSIVKEFEKEIDIIYKKFDFNLGNECLTKQWERCINLSKEEKYIWLFSDDDLAPPEAVSKFYEMISKNDKHDLYRFNICYIDQHGNRMGEISNHPDYEASEMFIKRRLEFKTISSACEYIFSRKVFNQFGFINFPLGWCADDASWARFGQKNGIVTISSNPVQFRLSGFNISTDKSLNDVKFNSALLYLKWCISQYDSIDRKLVTIYLAGQTRILGIKFKKRLVYFIRFLNLVGFWYAFALVLKRASFYRLISLYD